MKSSKSAFSGTKIPAYLLTLVLGAFLAVGVQEFAPWQRKPESESVAIPNTQDTTALAPPTTTNSNSNQNFVTQAVAKVGPAVVRIDTQRAVSSRPSPFFDDPSFGRFFGEELPRRLPREGLQRGQGSGLIIDSDGTIITNAHVVSEVDVVTVKLKDGRTLIGEVRGIDEVTDLAIIKIDSPESPLPTAPLGDSEQLQVGDWAIALGNPLGLDNTVTLGIISTIGRSSTQAGLSDKRLDFIQTDAAINPGNSGGPLLNDQGEVIGINTAIRADARGIGFAIPINQVKEVKDVLIRGETVPHPFIGIQMLTLTSESIEQHNSQSNAPFILPETEGVLVIEVLPNTPAQLGGIRSGDVIVALEGQTITQADQLQDLVQDSQVGDILQLQVQRGDQILDLNVRTAQLRENN